MAKEYRYISHLAVLIAKLNAQRKNRGLPPVAILEIKKATGVSRQSIYRWLKTDEPLTTINESVKEALMEYFGVSEGELYTRIELTDEQQAPGGRELVGSFPSL